MIESGNGSGLIFENKQGEGEVRWVCGGEREVMSAMATRFAKSAS